MVWLQDQVAGPEPVARNRGEAGAGGGQGAGEEVSHRAT